MKPLNPLRPFPAMESVEGLKPMEFPIVKPTLPKAPDMPGIPALPGSKRIRAIKNAHLRKSDEPAAIFNRFPLSAPIIAKGSDTGSYTVPAFIDDGDTRETSLVNCLLDSGANGFLFLPSSWRNSPAIVITGDDTSILADSSEAKVWVGYAKSITICGLGIVNCPVIISQTPSEDNEIIVGTEILARLNSALINGFYVVFGPR